MTHIIKNDFIILLIHQHISSPDEWYAYIYYDSNLLYLTGELSGKEMLTNALEFIALDSDEWSPITLDSLSTEEIHSFYRALKNLEKEYTFAKHILENRT